jgi:hypothetical protein
MATFSYRDSTAPLTEWDAHLAFVHLPEDLRAELLADARRVAHEEMQASDPDHHQVLADEDGSDDAPFSFEAVALVESRRPDEGPITPSDGLLEAEIEAAHELDPDVRDLAEDWAEEYLSALRQRVDRLQKSTALSNREFVAFVLAESPRITWSRAAASMGIAEGTFSGKVGEKVRPKIRDAAATVDLAERVGDGG